MEIKIDVEIKITEAQIEMQRQLDLASASVASGEATHGILVIVMTKTGPQMRSCCPTSGTAAKLRDAVLVVLDQFCVGNSADLRKFQDNVVKPD